MDSSLASIPSALARVRDRIANAAARAGRPAHAITLVAVSKMHPLEAVHTAIEAGQTVFGENRVQEAQAKFAGINAELHLIGALQTNKAKDAVRIASMIQSLDRPRLSDALHAALAADGDRPMLLIEVNVGDESQKSGVPRNQADAFINQCIHRFGNRVQGLMCVPPLGANPEPHFAWLADRAARHGLPVVSMGMSDDFEAAIRQGSTCVRVGTAIFGRRM